MTEKTKQEDPCADKEFCDALFGLFDRYVEQKRKDEGRPAPAKAGRIQEAKND